MFDSQEKPAQDTDMFKNEKDSEPSTTTMTTTTTITTTTTTQPLSEPEAGMNDLHVKPSTQDITYKDGKDSSASVKRLTSKTKYVAQEFISFTKTTTHLLNFAKICIGISPFICLLYVIKK